MNVIAYAGLSYLLTASISLLVIGVVVFLNRAFEKIKQKGRA